MASSRGIRVLVMAALVAMILAISSVAVAFVSYEDITPGAQGDEVAALGRIECRY